ncbi:Galactose binding lectin domain-containing protein [Salegentibacter holothuriorum]|uniref:Galactose binding lectin domain-containing protein n=1 Tax=Salegentibacter holothuriorum TaxID=241145 RepID=A0A1T5AE57_9FLAO|nr:SUEL-type lectin domain-containing protein [Salegentibacter holothuriorum]SKB33322.1 Galactose binding lectin domain-containing protein [Salegentibacter holothuriorum]
MTKKYPQLSSCFKPGFFLVVFLLFSFGLFGQSISNVKIEKSEYCSNEQIEFSFTVTNGNGNRRFDEDSEFTVKLFTPNDDIATLTFDSNKTPSGNWNSNTITDTPRIVVDENWPESDQYRLAISSKDPTVQEVQSLDFTINRRISNPKISNKQWNCKGGNLKLNIEMDYPVQGINYTWTGPNGFSSNLASPNIQAIEKNSGIYTVELNSKCSAFTLQQEIIFVDKDTKDVWRGEIFDNSDFSSSLGFYYEKEEFNQNFGIFNFSWDACTAGSVATSTFSVKYSMETTRNGIYTVDLGSDNGSELFLNNESIHVNNNVSNQWYSGTVSFDNVLLGLKSGDDLKFDYYELNWSNRVYFQNLELILKNEISSNTNSVCLSGQSPEITGDAIPSNLPDGITAVDSGYQWYYSENSSGDNKSIINGAVSKNFTPNLSTAPFDTPGTYYLFREVKLNSTNNFSKQEYQISHFSNGVKFEVLKATSSYTETEAGDDSWIGHVYDGNDFETYIGGYTETEEFSQNFGGNVVDFELGEGNCAPTVRTTTFSIRYKNASSSRGLYVVDLTSDDGIRFKINDELIHDNWVNRAPDTDENVLLNFNRDTNNLDYEYYENTGQNEVAFQNLRPVSLNSLRGATQQNFCVNSDAEEIIADEIQLFNGISLVGTGYQWFYSNEENGSKQPIPNATGKNFTPDISAAPFNNPGTYYIFRQVSIASVNNRLNGNFNSKVYKNFSNPAKLVVNSTIQDNDISFFNGNSGTINATANEDQQLNIDAPKGTVFTYVDFASYGTPTNNNGDFSINENCHATTSQSVTESYLLGENSASISATNAVFTDPCAGTFKRLYVKATYSETFCKGNDPGTINGTALSGPNVSFAWLLSKEGPSSGFAPAPGNNTAQNYNPGILSESIWLKRIVNSGGCSSESPVLYIPVTEENTWTGAENTNWNNINNWSCNSLPTLETNVLIPENLASGNYPEINIGNNALAKNLVIENNASVLVDDNWLQIAGDLTNNGILNTETGSISFQGATTQIIPEAAFQNNRIRNLSIDNSSGVTSEAIIEVTGTLKVENGNFDTGNELTLISNEIQTALIDGTGNGQVIGLVSMQRYLDKAFGYKYFSSPFQNSIVGDFEPFMNFTDPISGFSHFYRYNENRNVEIDGNIEDATGWESYINSGNILNVSEGYALNFGTSSAQQTIELIGEVNNGPISSRQLENNHREYTKGFHLVGNPYPSPIDWNAAQGWTRDNIDAGIYFFTASENSQYTGTYTAYVNDVSTEDPNIDSSSENIIPSMQGFFIKVSDSDTQDLVTGSFGMNNQVRVTNFNQEFYRSQISDQKSLIRLEAGFNNADQKDAMVVYFSPYATADFEKEMDAHKLMNTDPAVPSFYNITEDKKELAINAIPYPESANYKKISLGIKAEKSGEMKIELAAIENLSPNFNIYLIDHVKSIGQNLSRKPEYSFNIEKGTNNSRFELMFSEEEVPSPAIAFNEPFDVKLEDGNVVIDLNLEEYQQGVLRASTITGQILQIKEGSGTDKVIFEGITSNGVYIINLQVGKATYAKKIVIKK